MISLLPSSMNDQDTSWRAPPLLTLGDEDAHIWQIDLDDMQHDRAALRALLTPDEIARAERYVFARDRDRFLAGRGIARTILAAYANCQPEALRFDYTSYGKPFLMVPNNSGLSFNVSHSHRRALIGITRQRRIGVDIEYMREAIAYEAIATDMFSAYENAILRTIPEPLRRAAFFACWTRKEAYIKARGEGLAIPLDQFDVSLRPNEPAALLRVSDGSKPESWSMRALHYPSDYAATVVLEGQLAELHVYRFAATCMVS